MKFACPKCNTRYSIADDKVPPTKTLRFPCKKCGNVIRLRRKGAKKAAPRKIVAPKEGATQIASLAELNKLRSQAARPLETSSPGGVKETTRVASVSEIRNMVEQSNLPTDGGEEPEWYVLVDGKQKGPITKTTLLNQLHNKEIDKRTYIWRDGMGDWKRIGKMEEFQAAANGAGDAACRVMAPINASAASSVGGDDEFSASTVSMDVRQLQAQLARTRDEDDSSRPTTVNENPVMVSQSDILSVAPESDSMESFHLDDPSRSLASEGSEPAGPDADPFMEAEPDVGGAELIEALSGQPTGDRMTRPVSDKDASDVLQSPELLPDDGNVPALQFDSQSGEQMAAQIAQEMSGFPEGIEEPVGSPLDGLGPTFSDSVTGSEVSAVGGSSFDDSSVSSDGNYLEAPPGESTRVFMATAGLYRRRRTHRLAAVAGIIFSMLLVTVVSLDITGVYQIPGMGLVYDMTGLIDPNTDRATSRVDQQLQKADLTAEERARLEATRCKLVGCKDTGASGKRSSGRGLGKGKTVVSREGIKDVKTLTDSQRSIAEEMFGDDDKKESKIHLADPKSIQAPNLPSGLTHEALYKVIKNNNRSMTLCMNEAMRKGEKLMGKMDIALTIAPNGTVLNAAIDSPEFRNTIMASCTMKRVRNWKFPKFNGEPVTVSYPYLLQMGY